MPTVPLPLVPNVWQVTTFGTIRNLPCDHVINYLTIGTPADLVTQTQAFASSDATAWMQAMTALLPNYYVHTSSRAVYLGSLAVPESSVITQQPGTTTDTIIAPQACVTWRHPVPVRGRGKQGRTNMPGPHHLAYDEATGKLNVGGITEYTTAWNTYQTNLANAVAAAGGNPFNLIVLDRKLGTYNTPGTTFIDPQVNTHRRWELRLSRHR